MSGRRLSLSTLGSVPASMRPPFDPASIGVGIVHLGIGAFHRAHQATFTQDALAVVPGDWGICGVTQRSGTVQRQLSPQDGLYSLLERSGRATRASVVGAVREVLDGSADPAAVVERIASPEVHVVTLTVTEKGYRRDPATGSLNWEDHEVRADLAGRDPRTPVGQLVAGIRARRRRGAGGLTVVSCDNLPDNGAVLGHLVSDLAERGDDGPETLDWIGSNVRFPSTMVDRIVPATTDTDRAEASGLLGVADEATVVGEAFRQWVVEDDFAGPRPGWEHAGVLLVDDARPWERAKVRLLNGSHSTLAYLGQLAGCGLVADALARPGFEAVVRRLMSDDVEPTLGPLPGLDLGGYEEQLLARFANRALRHRCAQIAADGSQKLPLRLVGTVVDRRRQGGEPLAALLGIAAWMRCAVDRCDDRGAPLALDDPLADAIAERTSRAAGPGGVVDALLGWTAMFPPGVADDRFVADTLAELLTHLRRDGAEATARHVTASPRRPAGPGSPGAPGPTPRGRPNLRKEPH